MRIVGNLLGPSWGSIPGKVAGKIFTADSYYPDRTAVCRSQLAVHPGEMLAGHVALQATRAANVQTVSDLIGEHCGNTA